jgi:hypothetical protein
MVLSLRIIGIFFSLFSVILQSGKTIAEEVVTHESYSLVQYCSDTQGYCLLLPSELELSFRKNNDLEWSVENIMPFDYVNFRLKASSNVVYGLFELGIGMHLNRKSLNARKFADIKDEGVKMSVKQYVAVNSSEVTVAGIKGVRDDFRLEKEFGWFSYSRVIIPFKDKFFVFLATLGNDRPVAANERLFAEIIESFKIPS